MNPIDEPFVLFTSMRPEKLYMGVNDVVSALLIVATLTMCQRVKVRERPKAFHV